MENVLYEFYIVLQKNILSMNYKWLWILEAY